MPAFRRRWACVILMAFTIAIMGAAPGAPAVAQSKPVIVFAAASLKNALDDVSAQWKASGAGTAVISYAGSPALARQIEQGAPADIFISADNAWMDHLVGRDLVRRETRAPLLGNRLALIVPADKPAEVELSQAAIDRVLAGGRLAIADVAAVPAGRYGKAALETLGLWDVVRDRLAQSENVRAAMMLVARGEAPLGLVYASDAVAEARVRVAARIPETSHPPIVYPAAILASSSNPDVAALLAFIRSDAARSRFEQHGFLVLD